MGTVRGAGDKVADYTEEKIGGEVGNVTRRSIDNPQDWVFDPIKPITGKAGHEHIQDAFNMENVIGKRPSGTEADIAKQKLEDKIQEQMQKEAYRPQEITAAEIAQRAPSQNQQALIQALQAQMQGGSIAGQQALGQGTAQAIATQRALAAGRGGAANLRAAERNIAGQQMQAAAQAAALDEQARMAAINPLAKILSQDAQLESQRAMQQAQLQQQAMLANQQAQAQAAELQQRRDLDLLGIQSGLTRQQIEGVQARQAAYDQSNQQMLGSLIGAGGGILAAFLSDERAKEDSQDIKKDDLTEFWKSYKPKTYKYKGKDDQYPGFMIQDIENTKLGKDMVKQANNGYKYYDQQKFAGILAATMKHMIDSED